MSETKQKISIVEVGELHNDPGCLNMLNNYLRELKKDQGLNVVFCEEDHASQNVKTRLENLNKIVSNNNMALNRLGFNKFLTTDNQHKLPYFNKKGRELLNKETAKLAYEGTPEEVIKQQADQIFRFQNAKESLQLSKILKELKIPYVGIELDTEQHKEMMKKAFQDNEGYLNYEQLRVKNMANNIIEKAVPKLKGEDGIIFVFGGVNHTHRLATYLKYLANQSEKFTNIDLKLVPIKCFSNYPYQEQLDNVMEAESVSKLNDPSYIISLYEETPCNTVNVKEDLKKGGFYSSEFDNFIKDAVTHVGAHEEIIYKEEL
jgi:hypothetical protein